MASRRDAQQGLAINPCTVKYWGKIKKEFDDLADAEKLQYIEIMGSDRKAWLSLNRSRAALFSGDNDNMSAILDLDGDQQLVGE